MFVSAAAASLEDTGEDYLKEAGNGVPGVGGGTGGMYGIKPAITSDTSTGMGTDGRMMPSLASLATSVGMGGVAMASNTSNNTGYISPGGDGGGGVRPKPPGAIAPASPGMSLLELAGACSEQQKTEDTAQGLLALSPARIKQNPTPSSQDSTESQAALF